MRENTDELLRYIDVAVCAERMCEQMGLSPQGLLEFLQARLPRRRRHAGSAACSGMARTARSANWLHWVPAERIVDTSGAGDVFHGAYVWSYLNRPELPWSEHFTLARAASAHKIQHLGNEAGLPGVEDVERAMMEFK